MLVLFIAPNPPTFNMSIKISFLGLKILNLIGYLPNNIVINIKIPATPWGITNAKAKPFTPIDGNIIHPIDNAPLRKSCNNPIETLITASN